MNRKVIIFTVVYTIVCWGLLIGGFYCLFDSIEKELITSRYITFMDLIENSTLETNLPDGTYVNSGKTLKEQREYEKKEATYGMKSDIDIANTRDGIDKFFENYKSEQFIKKLGKVECGFTYSEYLKDTQKYSGCIDSNKPQLDKDGKPIVPEINVQKQLGIGLICVFGVLYVINVGVKIYKRKVS